MKRVMGVDVGGTKTHVVIADDEGRYISEGLAGPANYQIVGIERAEREIRTAVLRATDAARVSLSDITYAVFGVSGVDRSKDIEILNGTIGSIMGNTPYRMFHDSFLGLRIGSDDFTGVVSICGTGAGHSGRNAEGKIVQLRNVNFVFGNFGGGEDVTRFALHYAFRSDEGTYDRSALETEIPKIFGLKDMEEVSRYLTDNEMTDEEYFQIPVRTGELALEGDEVCRRILRVIGGNMGRYTAAVIRRLGMSSNKVRVILIGGIFKAANPWLMGPYLETVKKEAPEAQFVSPEEKPVKGAVLLALDELHGMEY